MRPCVWKHQFSDSMFAGMWCTQTHVGYIGIQSMKNYTPGWYIEDFDFWSWV